MMIYLYVETHRVTGLRYFGKTTRKNPHSYKGSGIHWKRHIAKHGYDCETVIVGAFENADEATAFALQFSKEHNIVESEAWANMIPENAIDGGGIKGIKLSEEHKAKIRKGCKGINKGREFSEETRRKISESKMGTPAWNKGLARPEETRNKISETRILNAIGKGENNPMFGRARPDLAAKNKIPKNWINNGKVEKQIPKSEVAKYLANGFIRGRL